MKDKILDELVEHIIECANIDDDYFARENRIVDVSNCDFSKYGNKSLSHIVLQSIGSAVRYANNLYSFRMLLKEELEFFI